MKGRVDVRGGDASGTPANSTTMCREMHMSYWLERAQAEMGA
jgi:hypothetical protein